MVVIDDYKVNPKKKIVDNINIQIVYMPLISKMGYKYRPSVTSGDYVCIGSIIGTSNLTDIPLISSVSGTVVGFEDKYISDGKLVKCIVIENDFKERYYEEIGKKRNIAKLSKNEFIFLLKKCGISGMFNSDYPTYLKYEEKKNVDYLIVNGTCSEIMASADLALMYNKVEEILEGIDAIIDIMGMKKAYIALTSDHEIIIKKFLKHINTYPNIKIYPIEHGYPNGYYKYLESTILPGVDNDKIITDNVATIYSIYEALKYNKPLTDRIVTITGDGVKEPANYKLKIGTDFNELILKTKLLKKNDNICLIAGGMMMGEAIPSDNLIITRDLGTIIVNNKKDEVCYECIKCGKCNEVCPVNLLPALIMERKKNNRKLHLDSCIECGLCSYVCPSKIEVREIIREMKENIK